MKTDSGATYSVYIFEFAVDDVVVVFKYRL